MPMSVIIQRSTSPTGLRAQSLAHTAGAVVIYECDDNFLVIDKDTPAVGAYYSDPAVRRTFRQAACERRSGDDDHRSPCRCLRRVRRTMSVSCPPASTSPTSTRSLAPEAPSVLVIGYAGTITHGPDFALRGARPAPRARRRRRDGPSAVLRLRPRDPRWACPMSTSFPSHRDYPAFLRALSRVDWSFGIAPLADLPSRRGKSDNKYREYGACRIPAIYSDCPAYSRSVVDGRTGLLVSSHRGGLV